MVEVTEARPRNPLRIGFDLLFRRFPPIEPIKLPEERDHLLVVTPLWDKWIAHPMRSALKALGPGLGKFSIVTFSGGERQGQEAFVEEQVLNLTGKIPVNHWAMYVERLVPPEIRGTPKVTAYRVSKTELAEYPELKEIIAWFSQEQPAAA